METTINKSEIGINLIQLKGIYFVYYLLLTDRVVWIGSTSNLYKRLKQHKYQKGFDSVKLVSFESEINAKRFEQYELQRLKPEFNIFGKNSFIEPQLKTVKSVSIEDKIKLSAILNRN